MADTLAYTLENPELKDKALARQFGYGSPYAQRYQQWLYRTGLSSLRLPLELTPMGSMIMSTIPNYNQ